MVEGEQGGGETVAGQRWPWQGRGEEGRFVEGCRKPQQRREEEGHPQRGGDSPSKGGKRRGVRGRAVATAREEGCGWPSQDSGSGWSIAGW